jgi:photosystem II stability/assembly factor-like uncharacterized protein
MIELRLFSLSMKGIVIFILVLASTNTKAQWFVAYGPIPTSAWIADISFVNDSVGYACMNDYPQIPGPNPRYNLILKTMDYANTWDTVFFHEFICPCGNTRDFSGIHFINELQGWVCSSDTDTLLHTVDGGNTWSSVDTGLHELMMGNIAADDFGDIQFSSENFGIAFSHGGGSLHSMITEDGGLTWSIVDEINGYDLHLKDDCDYATAQSASLVVAEQCNNMSVAFWPVDEIPMRWVGHVHHWTSDSFVCSTTGIVGFNNFASALKTDDGGETYHVIDFPNATVDIDLEFFDLSLGYLSVRSATSAAFVLKTIDGGYTWYEQTVEDNPIDFLPVMHNINITSEHVAYAHEEQFIYRTLNGGGALGDVHTSTRTITVPQKIVIYPNPAFEELHISGLKGNVDQVYFSIYDINRRLLLTGKNPSRIDVGSLSSGLYILQIH